MDSWLTQALVDWSADSGQIHRPPTIDYNLYSHTEPVTSTPPVRSLSTSTIQNITLNCLVGVAVRRRTRDRKVASQLGQLSLPSLRGR